MVKSHSIYQEFLFRNQIYFALEGLLLAFKSTPWRGLGQISPLSLQRVFSRILAAFATFKKDTPWSGQGEFTLSFRCHTTPRQCSRRRGGIKAEGTAKNQDCSVTVTMTESWEP